MYKQAMQYFEKSIELCKNNDVMCLAIFYINAGKTMFLEGDIKKSKKYFLTARDIANEFDSYWKSVVIDAFLSLFYFIEKKYDESLKMLSESLNASKTINNPRDIGTVYFVQSIMAYEMEKSKEELSSMKIFLGEHSEVYLYNALKYLDEYRDIREIEYLKNNIATKDEQ